MRTFKVCVVLAIMIGIAGVTAWTVGNKIFSIINHKPKKAIDSVMVDSAAFGVVTLGEGLRFDVAYYEGDTAIFKNGIEADTVLVISRHKIGVAFPCGPNVNCIINSDSSITLYPTNVPVTDSIKWHGNMWHLSTDSLNNIHI